MSILSRKRVVVSGGFDPIHIGHIRLIHEARKLGDHLTVILNNDYWLEDKKGYVFMKEDERAAILRALSDVDDVVISKHVKGDSDTSVSRELEIIKPDVFANGGDRKEKKDIPETKTCEDNGIRMVFNVGIGGKIQSSSSLTDSQKERGTTIQRPWGSMVLYAHTDKYWFKEIRIKPGCRTSLQKHCERGELWMCIEGEIIALIGNKEQLLRPFGFVCFEPNVSHRISSQKGGVIVEIGFGSCREEDNVRIEDDYGRA